VIDPGYAAIMLAFGLTVSGITAATGYFFAGCVWEIAQNFRTDNTLGYANRRRHRMANPEERGFDSLP
jgi:hypothetical protein